MTLKTRAKARQYETILAKAERTGKTYIIRVAQDTEVNRKRMHSASSNINAGRLASLRGAVSRVERVDGKVYLQITARSTLDVAVQRHPAGKAIAQPTPKVGFFRRLFSR